MRAVSAAVSPNLLMGAVLGGFLFRLMAMSAVVLPIRDLSWFYAVPFAVTLVVALVASIIGVIWYRRRRGEGNKVEWY